MAGLGSQPVADALAGHRVEFSAEMHHPVIAVPHPYTAASALTCILALTAVALAFHSPAAGLLGELLRPHRLRLVQQIPVILDIGRAGLPRSLRKPPGVRHRDPPRLHRVTQPGRAAQSLSGLDLAAGLLPRQPSA